jgi:hypothetical protein
MRFPLRAAGAAAAALCFGAALSTPSGAEEPSSATARARLFEARHYAKIAAFDDLSIAERAKVHAVIDQVNNGELTNLRAAAAQIGAALTPAETKAVLVERDRMIRMIHPEAARDLGARGAAARESAGRFLLQLGITQQKAQAFQRSIAAE